MTWKAKAYIAVALALGGLSLGRGLLLWSPWDPVRFVCYFLVAIFASGLKVSLPGVTGTMSVLFVFLLAAISELGLQQALVISVFCILVQCYWHAEVRPRLIQVLFSVANIVFAVAVTDYVYHLALILALPVPFRLAIAASVFFVTNVFPVAGVIALTEGKSVREVLITCYLWCFPYYLVGAALVGAFSYASRLFDFQVGVLIVPVVYVIYRSYRLYLKQLRSERENAEKERRHSLEVAALHEDTVSALASATTANARLEVLLGASPLAILALDRQRNVTNWNKTAEAMFGWSAEEILGQPLPFSGTESAEVVRNILDRTFNGEPVSGSEAKQLHRDGTPFQAEFWTAPLRVAGIDISEILVLVADISDRRRLEDQLRLSQKMEAVGRLAGGVAHDFNNLLTVINGYSAMLIDSAEGNSSVMSHAQEILGAGTRAAELVSQLLSFSRRQIIKPRPLEMNHLVQDVERMLQRVIGEHIELRTELDPQAGWIHADRNQMEGVLLNLATNARDAMPAGGVLAIRTRRIDITSGRVSPQSELAEGSYVCLSVKDTGNGMDGETQQHVFEPFFTTKQLGKGTGLGLSSVYGSIEQNHGYIFLDSEVGKGTTFSIYMPRQEHTTASKSSDKSPAEASRGVETILLVEDEGSVRRMFREALSIAGYRVWEAGNGAEAIAKWAAGLENIDLLVTDIVMPVMNGLKLAEELRSRRSDLRVIFMSGHSEEVINGQNGPHRAQELLQKPFAPQVLVRRVRDVLDVANAQRPKKRAARCGRGVACISSRNR